MSHPFRLYGHRGDAAHHPENTSAAFRSAVDKGVDALETDVRMTADREIVVFHDADGARTCGVHARIADTPWSEVSTWDAGGGQAPMLLSELLAAFPSVFVNVDVKDDDEEAALRALEVVRGSGREQSVGLGSFHASVSKVLRDAGWSGQLALGPREVAAVRLLPGAFGRRFLRGNAAQIPTRRGAIRLDGRGFLRRCHRLGLRVDYWTIDDPSVAVELVRRGADGIVTNDPGTVGAALRAQGVTS